MEQQNGGEGFGIASMVLGIVSVICSCCFYYIALPCAIIGVAFGAISIKKGGSGKGMGIAGLVCSIVGLVPAIITLVIGGTIMSWFKSIF